MQRFFREVYMDSVFPILNSAELPPSGAYHLEPSSPNWAGATAFSHLELFLETVFSWSA